MEDLNNKIEKNNIKIQEIEKEKIILETNINNEEKLIIDLESELNDMIVEKFGSLDILKTKKIEEIIKDLTSEVDNNNLEIEKLEDEIIDIDNQIKDLEE